MENTKRSGMVPVIIGMVFLAVALVLRIVHFFTIMSFGGYSNYEFMLYSLTMIGAVACATAGVIKFAVNGTGRVLIGACGIILAVDHIIIPLIRGGFSIRMISSMFDQELFALVVIIIFSFWKISGSITPIMLYMSIGVYLLDMVIQQYNLAIYMTGIGGEFSDFVNNYLAVPAFMDNLSMVLFPLGLILALPIALHIREPKNMNEMA